MFKLNPDEKNMTNSIHFREYYGSIDFCFLSLNYGHLTFQATMKKQLITHQFHPVYASKD